MLGSGMDHFNHTWLKGTSSCLCWGCWEVKSSCVPRRKGRRDFGRHLAICITISPFGHHPALHKTCILFRGEKPTFHLTILSVLKTRISRWGSDHCFRSRSDFSKSSMLWTKKQVTCLLSGQLIYKADRIIVIKTLREVPSPQQWWTPVLGDIVRNPTLWRKCLGRFWVCPFRGLSCPLFLVARGQEKSYPLFPWLCMGWILGSML